MRHHFAWGKGSDRARWGDTQGHHTDAHVRTWRRHDRRREIRHLRFFARTVFEWYDFYLYAVLAPFFAALFFPPGNDTAALLFDEPGLSLHGLKQREFRRTISGLAKSNQTLYTTHSPFLVGPDELGLVRVVELTDRKKGTIVHTQVTAEDPGALLPLQEALSHDLAQSLFAQPRNLVVEGLTDLFYLEATADLLRAEYIADLDSNIALIPATSAAMVVYYATILHARKLKVAALLDSDSAGDEAAKQAVLLQTLGNKAIIRTKDAYTGPLMRVEMEDLLRHTLVGIAKAEFAWDIAATAAEQPNRPILEIFKGEIPHFSKYKLAKAYVRWTRGHAANDLSITERVQWTTLIEKINASFDEPAAAR